MCGPIYIWPHNIYNEYNDNIYNEYELNIYNEHRLFLIEWKNKIIE